MGRLTLPIASNPRPAIDFCTSHRFRRVMLAPWSAMRGGDLLPSATVTIDDRSESGAWARALRDTPHIDRQLGRTGE